MQNKLFYKPMRKIYIFIDKILFLLADANKPIRELSIDRFFVSMIVALGRLRVKYQSYLAFLCMYSIGI